MRKTIKPVKLNRLLFISLVLIIIPGALALTLSKLQFLEINHPVSILMSISGLIIGIIFIHYWNDKEIECIINNSIIQYGQTKLKWSEIRNFKIENSSPLFSTLKIRTKSGQTIKLSSRNNSKNQLDGLIEFFRKTVENQNKDGLEIVEIPSIWDTKKGKLIGLVIILVNAFLFSAMFILELKFSLTYIPFILSSCFLLNRIYNK